MTTRVSTDMIEIDLTGVYGIVVLNQPVAFTYPIQLSAAFGWQITHINTKAASGSINFTINVDGVATGEANLTNETINTSASTHTPASPVAIPTNSLVEIVFDTPSTPGIITLEVHGART